MTDPTDAPTPDFEQLLSEHHRHFDRLDDKATTKLIAAFYKLGRADAAASRAPKSFVLNDDVSVDGDPTKFLRAGSVVALAASRAPSQDDALIELNGQAIAALEKARRMLSTELDAGSFGHPDTMHHAKNIAQIVVEDIDNALMRNADGRVAAGARAVPSRMFPIQNGPDIPWSVIEPFDKQCQKNHGRQTLERLAERGGLSVAEALAVMHAEDFDVYWKHGYPTLEVQILRLTGLVRDRLKSACAVTEMQADKWSYEKAAAEEGHVVDAGVLHPAVRETQANEPCRCAKPAPLVPGAKCRRCHRWTVAAVETDGTMRTVAAKQDDADWPDTWICQKCGNRWSMAQGKCSHDGTDRPAVPVQEEKQHDAIGGPLHAAGNVDMCNCDTCRLPTRNLLEIGSIPNVTTGQPQRVFVEWPSSAIPVPAVSVQDAPPAINKLLRAAGEQP